jgi:hypothetical protein
MPSPSIVRYKLKIFGTDSNNNSFNYILLFDVDTSKNDNNVVSLYDINFLQHDLLIPTSNTNVNISRSNTFSTDSGFKDNGVLIKGWYINNYYYFNLKSPIKSGSSPNFIFDNTHIIITVYNDGNYSFVGQVTANDMAEPFTTITSNATDISASYSVYDASSTDSIPNPLIIPPIIMSSPTSSPTSIAPVTTSYAPVTTSYAPVTTSYAPVTTSYAPVTTSYAPVTTSYAPITTSYAPVTTSYAPVTTRYAPVTTSYAPVTTRYAQTTFPNETKKNPFESFPIQVVQPVSTTTSSSSSAQSTSKNYVSLIAFQIIVILFLILIANIFIKY